MQQYPASRFIFAILLGGFFSFLMGFSAHAATRSVTIGFAKTEGAKLYQVEVKVAEAKDTTVAEVSADDPSLRMDLPSGWHWLRTRAMDAEGNYGPWSGWQDFLVAGDEPVEPEEDKGTSEVSIAVNPLPEAKGYQIELRRPSRQLGTDRIFDSPTADFKIAIPYGEWRLRVRAIFADGTISKWSSVSPFEVPFPGIKILRPARGEVLDPDDDLKSSVDMEWLAQPGTHHYLIYIYDEEGKFVHAFASRAPSATIQLPAGHAYRWNVVARGPGEAVPELKLPKDAPTFRIEKYVLLQLAASEEPSDVYGWGRYWISSIDYHGRNQDLNSQVSQKMYVSSGEVAMGYWNRKTQLGALVHGELSGFIIGPTTYNYVNAGVDFGYRKIYESGSRLRMWIGGAYREFPELLRRVNLADSPIDYHRVGGYGPQMQISYMGDFSPKYGWHTYMTAYQSVNGLATPNHLTQIPEWTYTVGLFTTYKYDENQKWMLGYSYRRENLRYKSTDQSGIDNVSSTTGHFLNLSVEFGLSASHAK